MTKLLKDPWTVKRVKEELPSVQVKLPGGKILNGRLSGRKNPAATVCVGYSGTLGEWVDFHASWTTLVHCLNTNSPLEV